jgi:hypothetical protein
MNLFLLLCWGYIVTFSKFLTICKLYHSLIHPLYQSPLPPSFHTWNNFNRYHFSIFIHVHTVFALYSSYYTFFPHPLPTHWYQLPRQDLLCLLDHGFSKKHDIFVRYLHWEIPCEYIFIRILMFEYIYTWKCITIYQMHCIYVLYVYINKVQIGSSALFFSFLSSSLLMLISIGLKSIYSLLYRKYINHIHLLNFFLLTSLSYMTSIWNALFFITCLC